jgi:hypothetical protein
MHRRQRLNFFHVISLRLKGELSIFEDFLLPLKLLVFPPAGHQFDYSCFAFGVPYIDLHLLYFLLS